MKKTTMLPLLIITLLSSFSSFSQRRVVGVKVDGEMIFSKPVLRYSEDGGTTFSDGSLKKGQGFGLTEFLHIPLKRDLWFGQEASYMWNTQKFGFETEQK